ncbi:MAG: hypothetical protein D3914_07830, partial [Candidatus Electrothrix sp. LOE2]|nr:hypothetical protein [Candidatus Electrothrix sp. LOE2]
MGNVGAGFDNDNDGVPDKNAWMQPVGDPSLYDAGCFRLVRTYGIVIVKQQNGNEHLIPFVDQLYFEHIPDNTGAVGLVFYEYAALNGVCRGALSPYQEVASGYDNEKFAGDYGTAIQMETREPLAFIAKNVFDDSLNPDPVLSGSAQTLVYQIEVTNPNTYTSGGQGLIIPIGDPGFGTPIVTRDSIPPGTEYIAGSAKFIANTPLSPIVPVAKSGTILYSTDNGISWSTTEPAANTVTDIEWWLDEPLTSDDAAGKNTMKVEFRVSVPGTYPDPYVTNIGCAAFGTGPCFDEDDAITLVNGTNQIVGDLWEDTGAGNDYGDGEKDTGESNGIIGVDVAVYYDTDNSGDYSEGDILWETVTTDGTGHYQTSTTLPNGEWVLVVGSLPSLGGYDGWANTTDVVHAVDGLATAEVRQAPDTGYAPALTLDKDVHNPDTGVRVNDDTVVLDINEGDTVTYTIDVKNTLYDPNSVPTCTRIVWADLGEQGSGTGVQGLTNISASDDQYAQLPINTQAESIKASGFTGVDTAWGNITALETVLEINNTGYATSASKHHDITITTDITYNAGATNEIVETTPNATMEIEEFPNADGSLGEGLWSYDILGTRSITLADLDTVMIEAKVKRGYAETATFDIDAIGLRITTDQPCGTAPRDSVVMNPVPLKDTFDANKLEFVSALPSPNRVVAYDDGDSATDMYRIEWDNLADSLGDLGPGDTHSVTVNFKALQPQTSPPTAQSPVTNTANIDSAKFKTGTPANTADDKVDVDLYHTAKIGNFIWNDVNGDSLQDGESGIAGVDVYLCTSTNPCTTGAADAVKTTTDSNGYYEFPGLADGTYYLLVDTTDLPGTHFNTTPTGDPDGVKDSKSTVTITNSGDNLDQDWGYKSTRGTISGDVWEDKNGDAVQAAGDDGFTDWTVELLKVSDNSLVKTELTTTGAYSFKDLDRDSYYVRVTPNTGYNQTFDYDETGVCTICNNQSDTSSPIVIDSNENITNVDFAYQTTGGNTIGNRLYSDLNGDGAEQSGLATNPVEPGIPNVEIFLYEDSGSIPGVLDPGD